MGIVANFIYIFVVCLFLFYLFLKFYKRNILFSCFNISYYIYFFDILISPIFYKSSEAWLALNIIDFKSYFYYLDMCLSINGLGFIFMTFSMILIEFTKYRQNNIIYKLSGKINISAINNFYLITIVAWYIIVLVYNKGLPLFNGGRTFYYNLSISPFYLCLNEMILIYAIYFGTKIVYCRANLIKWLICLATLAFTGNRGVFLISACVPTFILFIYSLNYKNKKINYLNHKKMGLKASKRIVILLLIALIMGLILNSIRNGTKNNLATIFNEILYGNTFSDIRDGAFILKGYENLFGAKYLLGKTYFAGIISFIPSGISAYRHMWSWGRFSTTMLFGWTNHGGLRGGNVMEAYLNFGFAGIVIFSLLQGALLGFLEKNFYNIFVIGKVPFKGKEFLILYVIASINNLLVCTAGMFNLYVDIIFVILIILLSKFKFTSIYYTRKNNNRKIVCE